MGRLGQNIGEMLDIWVVFSKLSSILVGRKQTERGRVTVEHSFAAIRSENSVFPNEEVLSCSLELHLKVSLFFIGKESLISKIRTHEKMSTFTIVWIFYWLRAVQLSCFIQNHSL